MARAIGIKRLDKFGILPDAFSWSKYAVVDVAELPKAQVQEFVGLLRECQGRDLTGAALALKDAETWLSVLERPGGRVRMRKVEHFETLLVDYLLGVPGPRLYSRHSLDREAWLGYQVSEVRFHPEVHDGDRREPAYVEVGLAYEEFGLVRRTSQDFRHADVAGLTVEEALAKAGLYAETPELKGRYAAETKRYLALVPKVGLQMLADGVGEGREPDGDGYSHHGYATRYEFRDDGSKRNRVVVDVFEEEGARRGTRAAVPDLGGWFWASRRAKAAKNRTGSEDVVSDDEVPDGERGWSRTRKGLPAEDAVEAPEAAYAPIHPFLMVFDMARHVRAAVHVAYLREYAYDKRLADKLVLPAKMKRLVRMLVEHREGGFVDIVAGKAGGAIVLLTGPPGVGKTLTAEVFSEAEERPLFSVQASQLGTDPDRLEAHLMLALKRAARWGAVMLLDEADVYVRSRGDDLQQNAIVGVFLRVLEYHSSVLFLTTNRPDLVDDAIASRCVAKLDYPYPDFDDQVRIWRILADNAGVALATADAEEFARRHPDTSGRDVKNLLKLAALVSGVDRKPVDLERLEYVLQFKPTVSVGHLAEGGRGA